MVNITNPPYTYLYVEYMDDTNSLVDDKATVLKMKTSYMTVYNLPITKPDTIFYYPCKYLIPYDDRLLIPIELCPFYVLITVPAVNKQYKLEYYRIIDLQLIPKKSRHISISLKKTLDSIIYYRQKEHVIQTLQKMEENPILTELKKYYTQLYNESVNTAEKP